MEKAGYKNYYEDVDDTLAKTIRYRQMVGLITSSSIRGYWAQQRDSTRTKNTNIVCENVADISTLHSSMKEDDLACRIDSAKLNRGSTVNVSDSEVIEEATSDAHRLSKNKHVPIAVDVIQYIFHNNNLNDSEIVKNVDANSLCSMKLQEKQRTTPTKLKIQQHHPGYIPTPLWQQFHEDELCDKSKSTSSLANEDAVNSAMHCNRYKKRDAANHEGLQFMPTCFDCGGVIQPGVINTTIRMVELKHMGDTIAAMTAEIAFEAPNVNAKLSRTQRRRESRFKAKLSRKEYYGSKQQQQQQQITNGNVPTNPPNQKSLQPHAKSNIWQYVWQQQNKYHHNRPTTRKSLKSVYPFLNCAAHYFALTCGSCGAKIFLPDFYDNNTKSFNIRNNKSNVKTKKFQRNATVSENRKKQETYQILSPSNSAVLVSKNTDKNQLIRDDIDIREDLSSFSPFFNPSLSSHQLDSSKSPFGVSSPTIGVKRKELDAEKKVTSQAVHPVMAQPAATILLPVHQQRKQKKPKTGNGKNDLMAFLSSLNDR